jgi:hypothetical protein
MNDPPTAVGGICGFVGARDGRRGMNDPPTAVGGIRGLLEEFVVGKA